MCAIRVPPNEGGNNSLLKDVRKDSLIQDTRGVCQGTFTEVTETTGEEGEGEVRDWHRAEWGWRDPATFQTGVVKEGGEQGRVRVGKGASDRDGAV